MREITTFLAIEDKEYREKIQGFCSQFEQLQISAYPLGRSCLDDFYMLPHIVFFSMNLPDFSGSAFLKKVKKFDPDITMVVVAGNHHIDLVPEVLTLGVFSYLHKEKDSDERITDVIKNALNEANQKIELRRLQTELGKKYKYSNMLRGKSQWMLELYSTLEKAGRSSVTVSLFGEPGSGKRMIAKTIHFNSSFAGFPFVEVSVGAIPENLILYEFFGTEKLLATGKKLVRIGKFEEAQHGTIYIRDIDKLSAAMQDKLSEVIREKRFARTGSDHYMIFNSRIIVSSKGNLLDAVNSGKFSEDLYYKLMGLPIWVMPLRERDADIVYLAQHFLNEFCHENNLEKAEITTDALRTLLSYPYPGNIRELKTVVELAAIEADGATLSPEHIHFYAQNPLLNLLLKENTLQEYIRQIIRNYLQRYNNDMVLVAKKLDIGKSTIYKMRLNGEF